MRGQQPLPASSYPLWSLVVIAIEVVVLYALTARWSEVEIPELLPLTPTG